MKFFDSLPLAFIKPYYEKTISALYHDCSYIVLYHTTCRTYYNGQNLDG